MPLWIFRMSVVVGIPFLVYVFIAKDERSLLLGALCGLILVAAEIFLRSLKMVAIMIGVFGALMGYLTFVVFDYCTIRMNIPEVSAHWAQYETIAAAILTMLGGFVSIIKANELEGLGKKGAHLKIVDMPALIDGRIVDLAETGFLSGTLVLPQFVVDTLSRYAASKDPLKKARGRRGLDIITRLKELKSIPVRVTSKDFKADSPEDKIVKLAQHFRGPIVTTDFNINKAAARSDTPVLNISDLTTALKPVVLPGEDMSVFVMKDGKEKEQGIGYLDDGTMIVVEDGRKHIGKRAEVCVHSILQTSSGRMIFARTKNQQPQQRDA